MKMNKFLVTFLFVFTALFSSVSAYDYYSIFEPSFSGEQINEFYVEGAICADSQCKNIISQDITLMDTKKFAVCYLDYMDNKISGSQLSTCLDEAQISGNTVNVGNTNLIVVKESGAPASFGSLVYFFPKGDSYVPISSRVLNYPENCGAEDSICFDNQTVPISFGRIIEAIAEVGQLNIKNVDNELKPIQVEVPVQIEETVCSAFRFANSNYWYPTNIPQGYSDFDALTQVSLEITRESNNQKLLKEQINIPIEADTCAGLAAFSWTPQADIEDERITFSVSTKVIDTQVITSLIDSASVTETIYPLNLDNTCWTRAYDFTLANKPTFDLNTGIAQIQEGEYLYGGFSGGAWRDNSITPMEFEAIFVFDNGQTKEFVETIQDTSGLDTKEYFVDLSDEISSLAPGNYEVSLITRPHGTNCFTSEDVTQSQQLTILEIPKYTLDVRVRDSNSNLLEGVQINLELIETQDEYQVPKTYDETLVTNSNGRVNFEGLFSGEYTYVVSKEGHTSVNGEVIIGSDSQLFITLPSENVAPRVDLPAQATIYFEDTFELNLKDYIVDFNDGFENLEVTTLIKSGTATKNLVNGRILEVSTNTPNSVVLEVTAKDPSNAQSTDSMTINFIDNSAPVINEFRADPTNGAAPFTTTFIVDINDREGDSLTCTIDFDDNSAPQTFDCNNINHNFAQIGQYNVELTVRDENNEVKAQEEVYVFERQYESPNIDTFDLESTNGLELPTDLTLSWTTSHPDNLPMTCTLRVNGVNNAVNCNGEFDLNNFNRPGESVFTLTAFDGEHQDTRRLARVFVNPQDAPPVINSFTATPTIGDSPLEVTFGTSISDSEDSLGELDCRVDFGDGTSSVGQCSEFTSFTHVYENNFGNSVSFVATIEVTDLAGNVEEAVSPTITVTGAENVAPQIEEFSATPTSAVGELNTVFTIRASDVNDDSLTYTLNFGDGESTSGIYTEEFTIAHTYTQIGTYTPTLVVNDGNLDDSETITLQVLENDTTQENIAPQIEEFSANPTSGIRELNTVFTIRASDVNDDSLTYTLNFGDGESTSGNYNGEFTIAHTYDEFGVFTARLTISDGELDDSRTLILAVNDIVNQFVQINEFSATPTSDIGELDTVFTIRLSDEDDDNISYTLNFGDGEFISGDYEDEFTVAHTYDQVGVFTATLTATDGITPRSQSINLEVISAVSPQIDLFNLESSNGSFIPTDLTFTIAASHPQGFDISCVLFVNGVENDISCNQQFFVDNYNVEGLGVFNLLVTDENCLERLSTIEMEFIEINNAPIINRFEANDTLGNLELQTEFVFEVDDIDGDMLNFTLNADNGEVYTGVTDVPSGEIRFRTNYTEVGTYSAILSVTDGVDETLAQVDLQVVDNRVSTPVIDSFLLARSNNNFLLPNDLTLTWDVSHTIDLDVNCILETPEGVFPINGCTFGSRNLDDFNVSGESDFVLIAIDENGVSVNQTITQTFYTPGTAPNLTLEEVSLKIDEEIVPGNFKFSIMTTNETLAKRELFAQPSISCSGVEHQLMSQSTFLPTIALSSVNKGDGFEFPLRSDTVDFTGMIPVGKTCLFELRVVDAYGTDITLVENVVFNYPAQKEMTPSINGFGTDVMDFLEGTIGKTFRTGYNGVDFTLVNHESKAKELSISLSSTQLGINFNEQVNLGPNSQRDVTVPLLFTKDQKGLFPIRVAVYDGENKQVKYSYIRIE